MRSVTVLILMAAAATAGGCGFIDELNLPLLTESGRRIDGADPFESPDPMEYPETAQIVEPIDIEIVRSGNAIRLHNRTVQRYENVQLWLNHQYGAEIDQVPIGESGPYALQSFVNQHGEPYPVALFLAPENDRPLVLADMVRDGRIHKLVVHLQEDWQEAAGSVPQGPTQQ